MPKSPTHLVFGARDSAISFCPGRASLMLPAANPRLCPLSGGHSTLRCISVSVSASPSGKLRARPWLPPVKRVQGVVIRATAKAHHKDDSLGESAIGFTSFRSCLVMSLCGRQSPGFHQGRPVRRATPSCVNTKHVSSALAVSSSAQACIQLLKFTQH